MTTAKPTEVYTTKAAAARLKVSTSRIDYLCKTLRLAFTMHGRDRAITKKAVERYEAQRGRRPRGGRPRKKTEEK